MDKKTEQLSANQKRLSYIAIVMVILALTSYSLPKDSKIVTGTTETMSALLTEEGNKTFWMVKLDSGQLVKVYVSNSVSLKQNQRIEMTEITSVVGS